MEDSLDDWNDLDGPKTPSTGERGGWSDKDLEDILGDGEYKPDKNKALVAPVSCRGAQRSENVHDLRLEEPLVETEEFQVQMMSYAAG